MVLTAWVELLLFGDYVFSQSEEQQLDYSCHGGGTKHREVNGKNLQKSNELWITPLTYKILDLWTRGWIILGKPGVDFAFSKIRSLRYSQHMEKL